MGITATFALSVHVGNERDGVVAEREVEPGTVVVDSVTRNLKPARRAMLYFLLTIIT